LANALANALADGTVTMATVIALAALELRGHTARSDARSDSFDFEAPRPYLTSNSIVSPRARWDTTCDGKHNFYVV
jgi:hypothetical protein